MLGAEHVRELKAAIGMPAGPGGDVEDAADGHRRHLHQNLARGRGRGRHDRLPQDIRPAEFRQDDGTHRRRRRDGGGPGVAVASNGGPVAGHRALS